MKTIIENLRLIRSAAIILAVLSSVALSQTSWTAPPPAKPKKAAVREKTTRPMWPVPGEDSEKSIKADKGVLLQLCVTQGRLKVNGWSRSEIRVLVAGGTRFTFNIRDKNVATSEPNWVEILSSDIRGRIGPLRQCLAASVIEIDLPIGAKLKVGGQEMRASFDSIKNVEVQTGGGDLTLRNITTGIKASARQGDIMVESSKGQMDLDSTSGNIVVFEASPSEIGDGFRAKTQGGTISLQNLQHRQVTVNSISGSVLYNGPIRNGGSYNVNTNRGSIRMVVPADSACQVQATFSAGNFNSELPLKLETENVHEGPIKTIVGRLGKNGDAFVKLTTNNGSITIRKQ